MRVKRLAQALEVSPDLLRKAERAGRLPRATRDWNGHRRYSAADVEQIRRLLYPDSSDRTHAA